MRILQKRSWISLVYAPLGLLLEAGEMVPRLADKGRRRMGGQVTVARMIGEMAVRQGRRQAVKLVSQVRDQTGPGFDADAGTTRSGSGPSAGQPVVTRPGRPRTDSPAAATPAPGALAIPGYDTLAASQVLPRLEGLSAEELTAVEQYEGANRARKTVLSRIAQLRGAGG